MQISKTILVVCTVVWGAGSISLAAPDSLSQAQAREALRKKIAELNAQEPVTETPAPVTKPAKAPKAVAAPKPVKQPEPVVVTQPPATVTPAPAAVVTTPPPAALPRATGEQLARQREALRQKIAELNAQEQAGQPKPAPATVTTIVKSPDTYSADVIKAEQAAAAAEQKRLADEAKAREADQKRAAAEAKARQAKKKPEVSTAATPATFAPIEPPPSAVPTSKEAKLSELLSKYKADAITPEEYHNTRAKILAEP